MAARKKPVTKIRVRLDFTIEVDALAAIPTVFAAGYKAFLVSALHAAQLTLPVRLLPGSKSQVDLVLDDDTRAARMAAYPKLKPGTGMFLDCIGGAWGDVTKGEPKPAPVLIPVGKTARRRKTGDAAPQKAHRR